MSKIFRQVPNFADTLSLTYQISTDMVKMWRITNKFLEVLSIFIAVIEAGKEMKQSGCT